MKLIIALALLACSSVNADQASIDSIEEAAMQLDNSQLVSLIQQNVGYEQALAYYRLAITQNLQDHAEQANNALEQAIILLETITENSPNDDESWALLAQAYGLKIAYQPMKGAYYGPKSGKALKQAITINPNNPRAFLVMGISKYNTPALFGGSKTAALEALNQAISLYDEKHATDIDWGEAETYVWRGLTQLELGKKEQALSDWKIALQIAPNYGWAKMLSQQNQ